MTFTPLFNASLAIQLHAVAAIIALFLGAYIFIKPKGTRRHRMLGKIWVAFMALAVLSSAFIFEIRVWGLFSPIHLLTIFSAISLVGGVWAARAGRIALHQRTMLGLYVGGLFIAGTFTFLPGRIMNSMFFGGDSMAGFYGVAALAIVVGIFIARRNRRPQKTATANL